VALKLRRGDGALGEPADERDHGLHSAPFASCHAAHDDGSPALAVDRQSAAADAGALQLTLQNVARSWHRVSGGGGGPGAPESASGDGDPPVGSVHAPRSSLAL
jgi:hypothetical protein